MTGPRVRPVRLIDPPRRPNALLVAWRWRYELATAALVPYELTQLVGLLGAGTTVLALSVLVAAIGACPPTRRLAVARWWGLVTPHRLRTGFMETGLYGTRGRLPAIVRCASRSWGERVTVLLPAGMLLADVRAERHRLAAACWARTVEIAPHPWWPTGAVLVGVRRR